MAYTDIDDPTIFFNTVLWTGNGSGSRSITGVGFAPDMVWWKGRDTTYDHRLIDTVRSGTYPKLLYPNLNIAESEDANNAEAIGSDGFTIGSGNAVNQSGKNYTAWNWSAGGSTPAITYSVKVVSDSGNKYRFDDFGTSAVTLDLQEGGTYTFDQSDSSNSGHPLRFSTTSDGSHGGGSEYTTGVTTTGTPGSAGAKTVITLGSGVATLYYYCTQHSGMGGQANTNSTHGSSNFSGSIQSSVSANTTAGFSIVAFTGNGTSGATVGHGLGSTPKVIILKDRDTGINSWAVGHESSGFTKYIYLNKTDAAVSTAGFWNNTTPTSSVFSLGNNDTVNGSGGLNIAYCFAEKKGYSKFGSYTGNGNADGTFVYTGFRPAFVLIKYTSASGQSWRLIDNKRFGYNVDNIQLYPNLSNAESTSETVADILSNGFKLRATDTGVNTSAGNYIYMAFAEFPLVNSKGVPTTAR